MIIIITYFYILLLIDWRYQTVEHIMRFSNLYEKRCIKKADPLYYYKYFVDRRDEMKIQVKKKILQGLRLYIHEEKYS